MSQAFENLERILKLEKQQGYQNKAVVGGFAKFVSYWYDQASAESVDEIDEFFVSQTSEILSGYNNLSGTEARAGQVERMLDQLEKRKKRVPAQTETGSLRSQTETEVVTPAIIREKPKDDPAEIPTVVLPAEPVLESKPAPKKEAKPKAKTNKPAVSNKENGKRDLGEPVTALPGVGERNAELLAKLGATTVGDLLTTYPRRYDDYTQMKPIHRLEYGEVVTIIGTIWQVRTRRQRNNQVIVQATVGDGSGKIGVTWFNQAWLGDKLKSGMQIVISGKVDQYLGRLVFNNPAWEPVSEEQLRTNRIVPIYPLTKGLGANQMRKIMKAAVDGWGRSLNDPLPEAIRGKHKLMHFKDAVYQVHFPQSQEHLRKAQQRLGFDEVFMLQLGMMHQRRDWQEQPAQSLTAEPEVLDEFYAQFPFDPTGAQQRVIGEIQADMAKGMPMNRLLQGDVGAGKTLVAAAAMVVAVKAGVQCALMAPTSILAEQHYAGLSQILEPLGVRLRLLTGNVKAKAKKEIYAEAETAGADVFIGTTALIQPELNFDNLGMVVIDEQHRFGVDQRGALRDKGKGEHNPHLLVMTATPIPRSLALSLYGDLDLSILDEMPPGRQEIMTRWLRPRERERAYGFIRKQADEGRQAYIIYPLVEESEKIDVGAAVEEHERLQTAVFPDLKLGLIHGRMKGDEKDEVMRTFKEGEYDILVSTTVIEVGIDVPNSTMIIIEDANRFGLAQLHQLRGRVGRGQYKSYCVLVSDSKSADSAERLTALEQTNDGFELAEKDLELRGPGEFFGRRQSGLPELQMASLFDTELLETARSEAQALVERDPDLEARDHAGLKAQMSRFWENAGDIS